MQDLAKADIPDLNRVIAFIESNPPEPEYWGPGTWELSDDKGGL